MVSHDSDVGSQPSAVVEPSAGSEGQEKGGPQPADLLSEDPVLEGSDVGGDSLGAQAGPVDVPPSDETPQPAAGSVAEMPAADGDSAGEEEDGSAGSDEDGWEDGLGLDEDGWEDGLSDTSQLSDITASQRGKLYSLTEISDFLEKTKDGLAEPVIDDAEPGGNITLKCGVDPSKINQYARARVSWYRQEPDGRIQIVTSLSTAYLKDGRYSGGIDNKNGQYNVTIADLHRNDSAVYFCIAKAAALQFVPGSSTKLVVSDGLAEPVIDDAEPGGNITLKCGVDPSKINQYAHARVSWYRQEPDGRIQIVTYLSTGYLNDGRYSGGIDNKNGQYNLTITGLRRNDSAVYFCIARAAALQFVPGSSTKLVVSDPLTIPSVELYSPGLFEGDSDWTEPVPVLCLVRDTSPGRHRVLWTIGAETAAPVSAGEGEIEPDGSYSVRSFVTISADQWNSGAMPLQVRGLQRHKRHRKILRATPKSSSI
ncbi:UNVERIFIED_CONTAM: hypothetical protein FKN15_055172 [Acipenser sinensis]